MPKESTTTIVYVGEAPACDIVIPGGAIHAENGKPVDVPSSLAKSLLEQDIFTTKVRPAKENE